MYTTCWIFPEGEFSWHDCAWDELASPRASTPQVNADRAARRSKLTKFIRVSSFRKCADTSFFFIFLLLDESGVWRFQPCAGATTKDSAPELYRREPFSGVKVLRKFRERYVNPCFNPVINGGRLRTW